MTLRQEILGYYAYWRPVLGLEGWDMRVRFDEKQCLAYCDARPKYLTATLNFNLKRIKKELKTSAEREELTLHEMVHVLSPHASETAVSQMTLSLLRARALEAP